MTSDLRLFPGWMGLLAAILVWTSFAFMPGTKNDVIRVAGENMLPQLAPGDLLLMHPPGMLPKRGEIVLISPTSEQSAMDALPDRQSRPFIARVAGLPGDSIELTGGGFVLRGGERIDAVPGPYWRRHGSSLRIPAGGHFALAAGDPTRWEKAGGASQFMGLFDIGQIRVTRTHLARAQIFKRAPYAVVGGGALAGLMILVLWICGRYCRPLLPLRMMLGFTWLALFMVLAYFIMAPFLDREAVSPLVAFVAINYRYFSWMGNSEWLNAAIAVSALSIAGFATWQIGRRMAGTADDIVAATKRSSRPFRLWPLVVGIVAVFYALVNLNLIQGNEPANIVAMMAGVAIPAGFWQCEVAAIKPGAGTPVVWLGRIIRGLRLCIGLVGLFMLTKLLIAASNSVFGVITTVLTSDFQSQALAPVLLLLYGLPGVRPRRWRDAIRRTFEAPTNPLRLAALLAVFVGLASLAFFRFQPHSIFRDEYRVAAEMVAHARPATEDFFLSEYRLPDELDTNLMFGSSSSLRGAAFVGPGVLRLTVPRGGIDEMRIFMIFEQSPASRSGIDYRCVHDEADFVSDEPALRRCVREPGFDARNYGSKRSLIARTPRAANGPRAETRIYFRLGGSTKTDMGPAMLPPPARNNTEAIRYRQMLEADLRATIFPDGNLPREIEIVGFADASGPEADNQLLSETRAESAKTYLIDLGIPTSLISTRGAGEEPIPMECLPKQGMYAECLYRSRRVDIRVWQ